MNTHLPSPSESQSTPKLPSAVIREQHKEEDVLRFLSDLQVPFTNNDSEREVRMPKAKLKIIGTFHPFHGTQSFATIQACCSSLKKQNHSILQAFDSLFLGKRVPHLSSPPETPC